MRTIDMAVGPQARSCDVVTHDVIVEFAHASGHCYPLHLDDAFVARTRFGGRIAHGMFSAAYISKVLRTQRLGAGAVYWPRPCASGRPSASGMPSSPT